MHLLPCRQARSRDDSGEVAGLPGCQRLVQAFIWRNAPCTAVHPHGCTASKFVWQMHCRSCGRSFSVRSQEPPAKRNDFALEAETFTCRLDQSFPACRSPPCAKSGTSTANTIAMRCLATAMGMKGKAQKGGRGGKGNQFWQKGKAKTPSSSDEHTADRSARGAKRAPAEPGKRTASSKTAMNTAALWSVPLAISLVSCRDRSARAWFICSWQPDGGPPGECATAPVEKHTD